MNDILSITKSLGEISMMMGDGAKFLKIRFQCEQWAKEAEEGNKDSAVLIAVVNRFECLLKAIDRL